MRSIVLSVVALAMATPGSAGAQEWRSAYTDTDPALCTTLAVDPGYSAELACPGYKGYPLLISDVDLRILVSYGFDAHEEMAAWQIFPNFNTIGEKLEWLIADDPE